LPSLCPQKLLLPNLCQSYSIFSHYMPMIFDFTLNPYAKHPCPTYAKPSIFCHTYVALFNFSSNRSYVLLWREYALRVTS
jgi:hypothetical protein